MFLWHLVSKNTGETKWNSLLPQGAIRRGAKASGGRHPCYRTATTDVCVGVCVYVCLCICVGMGEDKVHFCQCPLVFDSVRRVNIVIAPLAKTLTTTTIVVLASAHTV